MNEDTAATERMQRLLEVVEQQRDQRCSEIRRQATQEARRLLQQARREARRRVHGEILHARAQYSHQLVLQQARLAARQRQARYRAERELLDAAWEQLHAALQKRWQDADARQVWVEALIDQARARLVRRDWQIEHPGDWPAAEREATGRRVEQLLDSAPRFTVDAALQGGLRIRAGETVVDGSCDGLLRDKESIEARLLAAARERQSG